MQIVFRDLYLKCYVSNLLLINFIYSLSLKRDIIYINLKILLYLISLIINIKLIFVKI